MRTSALVVLLGGALIAPIAGADLVFLKSGKIIGGEISESDRGLVVKGEQGTVTIARSLIERFELGRTIDGLVSAKFSSTAKDADALYLLGRWFARHGLGPAADRAYKSAIQADADHLLSRRALGQIKRGASWVSHREVVRATGLVRKGGRWVSPGVKGAKAPQIVERAPAVTAERLSWAAARLPAISGEAAAARDPELKARAEVGRRQVVRSLVEVMLRAERPADRAQAAAILGRNTEVSAVPSLVRSAVADREGSVRKAAVEAINKVDLPTSAYYFLKPLECAQPKVRENAIEALGMIQSNKATEVLLKTMVAVYGGGPRVYIYVGTQQGYIKDYDVEVAESAAVADPEIGYVQSGAMLEFKIHRIMEYVTVRETQLIAKALEKRTGEKFGADPQRWVAWWKSEAKKRAAKRRQ